MSRPVVFKVFLWTMLTCFLVASCKPDVVTLPVVTEPIVLEGDWTMVKAYKGNVESRLLDNGLFRFTQDGKFSTNILRDTILYPYVLENGKISVSNAKSDRYIVHHKTTDTLILGTRLRNFDFRFVTVKSKLDK